MDDRAQGAPAFVRGRALTSALLNRTRGTTIATQVRLASSPWARGLGLMGHPPLSPGQALILQPESSIHTFFMRFPLDVLFLDKDGKVLHLYQAMAAWRLSRIVRGSRQIVEMAPGAIAASATQIGDHVTLGDAG